MTVQDKCKRKCKFFCIENLYHLVINITFNTSIELHSHWDMFVPSPRTNSDIATSEGRDKWMTDNCILITVAWEILKRETKRQYKHTCTFSFLGLTKSSQSLDLITSRCLGKEPVLLPQRQSLLGQERRLDSREWRKWSLANVLQFKMCAKLPWCCSFPGKVQN